MPNRDGTGPAGTGRKGKGLGPCSPNNSDKKVGKKAPRKGTKKDNVEDVPTKKTPAQKEKS